MKILLIIAINCCKGKKLKKIFDLHYKLHNNVVANVAEEEPSRSGPEDVWLLQPVEVRQGVQEQGLQQGGVDFGLRNRQQFVPSPLQDETVSSTTPNL